MGGQCVELDYCFTCSCIHLKMGPSVFLNKDLPCFNYKINMLNAISPANVIAITFVGETANHRSHKCYTSFISNMHARG